MSNPSYPGTLPAAIQIGYTEEPQAVAIKAEMDAGPAKQRKRFSVTWTVFRDCVLTLTAAQRATFYTFWHDTCSGGAQPFDWTHPSTGAAQTLRFLADKPPKFRAIAPDLFECTFDMETSA